MASHVLRGLAVTLAVIAAFLPPPAHKVSAEAVSSVALRKEHSISDSLSLHRNGHVIPDTFDAIDVTPHYFYPRDPPAEPSPDDPLNDVTGRSDLWTRHQRRGWDLYCGFFKSSKELGQSQWLSYSDLNMYGWDMFPSPSLSEIDFNFKTMCGSLGCSRSSARRVDWEHSLDWTGSDGKKNKKTGADYVNIFSPSGTNGIIIACWNNSPAFKKSQDSSLVVPPLNRWSDVVFLEWSYKTNWFNTRRLKYVVRSSVMNRQTRWTLRESFERRKMVYTSFTDAKEIAIEEEEGQAILGTPNGLGVAWLLNEHKKQLGKKMVKTMKVFWDDSCDTSKISGKPVGKDTYEEWEDRTGCLPNVLFTMKSLKFWNEQQSFNPGQDQTQEVNVGDAPDEQTEAAAGNN